MTVPLEPTEPTPKPASKYLILLHRLVALFALLIITLATSWMFHLKELVWGYFCSALVGLVLYRLVKDFRDPNGRYGSYYTMILCWIWPIYHEYTNYERGKRIEKYGIAFNRTREKLGVPIIPAGWHFKYPGNLGADWEGKKDTFGHASKYVGLDSLHRIEFERDEYNLKVVGDTDRAISILFRYARGKSKDSIFYWYNTKGKSLDISPRQADSIFAAAKVRKDY